MIILKRAKSPLKVTSVDANKEETLPSTKAPVTNETEVVTTKIPTSQKELTINAKEPDKKLTTMNLELNPENGSSDESESQVEAECKAGTSDVELDHSEEITAPVESKDIESTPVHVEDNYTKKNWYPRFTRKRGSS